MKNKRIFTGMPALLLAFGLIIIGCDMNGEENLTTKFEGAWKHAMESLNAVYEFHNDTWNFSSAGTEGVNPGPLSGTFSFDDASITFTVTEGGSGTWTQPYTLGTQNGIATLELGYPISGTIATRIIGLFNKQSRIFFEARIL